MSGRAAFAPPPLPELPDLPRELGSLLRQVPRGRVTTYGDLARALGDVAAARWVGHSLLHHVYSARCRCHRVVRAGGELGGYVGAAVGGKMRRLAAEGVSPVEGRVNLDRYAFRQFEADRPLERLRRYQQDLLKHNSLRPLRRRPKLIGGVDVSYGVPSGGAHRAVAAYALVDREGRLVWSTAVEQPVSFPYISSYLAFRELPVLLSLLKEVRAADRLSEVVLVDGAGIMHPRRAGVATHLGIAAGVATIGVTKKLLCGHHDDRTMPAGELTPVVHAGQRVGSAVRPTAGSRRRIYISPGHGLTPDEADEIAAGMLTGRQLPEPIYWADRLSRGALGSSGK